MTSKIIWQTGEPEYNRLKATYRNASETWMRHNPSWEYRYASRVDRAEEVKDFDKDLYKIYCSFNGMNQADIWRYIVIYRYGGAYADLDSVCTMGLDNLLKRVGDQTIILTPKNFQTEHPFLINNANFYAYKNSDMMRRLIDYIRGSYIGQDLPKREDYEPMIHFFFSVAAAQCKDKISYSMNLASEHGKPRDSGVIAKSITSQQLV